MESVAEYLIADAPPIDQDVFVRAVADICKWCLELITRSDTEDGASLEDDLEAEIDTLILCLVVACWMEQNGYGNVLRRY